MSIKLFVLPFIVLSALCYVENDITGYDLNIKKKCLEIPETTDSNILNQIQVVMKIIKDNFEQQDFKQPSSLDFGDVNFDTKQSNITAIQNKQKKLEENTQSFVFRFVLHNLEEVALHQIFLDNIEKIGLERGEALKTVYNTDCIYTWHDNDEPNAQKYLFFLYEIKAVQLGTLVTLDEDHLGYNNIIWQINAAKNLAIFLDKIHKAGYALRGMTNNDVLFGTKLHHPEVHYHPFFGDFKYIIKIGDIETNPPVEEQIGIIPDSIALGNRHYNEDFDKFKLGLIFYSLFTKSPGVERLTEIKYCDKNQGLANKYPDYCAHIEQLVRSLINYDQNHKISLEQVIHKLDNINIQTDKNIPVKQAQSVKSITTEIQNLSNLSKSYLTDKSKKQAILETIQKIKDSLDKEKTTHSDFLVKVKADVAVIHNSLRGQVPGDDQKILTELSSIAKLNRRLKNVDEALSNKLVV